MMHSLRFIILLLLLNSLGQHVLAQANTLLVYGNGLIDSQRLSSGTTSSYQFAPGAGYQWNDRWTGGLNLDWTGAQSGSPSQSVGLGPFVRYTMPLAGIFVLYGQLNANYVWSRLDQVAYRGFQAMVFPAIGVNLKNSFALNFAVGSLGFSAQRSPDGQQSLNTFHFGIANGAGFGLSKNFGLKRRSR